jgi:hypothetical protein
MAIHLALSDRAWAVLIAPVYARFLIFSSSLLQVQVDGAPDEFCNGCTGLSGQRLKFPELRFFEEQRRPPHTNIVAYRHTLVQASSAFVLGIAGFVAVGKAFEAQSHNASEFLSALQGAEVRAETQIFIIVPPILVGYGGPEIGRSTNDS